MTENIMQMQQREIRATRKATKETEGRHSYERILVLKKKPKMMKSTGTDVTYD